MGSLLIGQIFSGSDKRKPLLLEQIELANGKNKIVKTKMIYAQDVKNPTNFHEYVDGIPCVLIILKLDNGEIIGVFSEKPLTKENEGNLENNGLLFNIDRKKYYKILEDKKIARALMYD